MSIDVLNWMNEVQDIPKKAVDNISKIVLQRFNGAVAWQSAERVNGKPLRTVLRECWEQQNGIMSCEDQERAKALGVNVMVNLTALKVGVANAYLTEALTSGSSQLPWIISPTPRPELSPLAREQILQEVKAALAADIFPDESALLEYVRQMKSYIHRQEQEVAQKSADEMMMLIEDQCSEGGFQRAMIDFLQYFPVYPFSVFTGPYIVRAPRLVWGKKKPRLENEVFPTFRAVSPFDFCYSPDSPDTQRGSCVFIRTKCTRKSLLDAAKLETYNEENIRYILENAERQSDFNLNWLSRNPEEQSRNASLWWQSNVAPMEVLTHYGLLSGRELSEAGVTGLDDDEFYNCEVAMVYHRIIRLLVCRDPKMQTRPVYTASFYRTGGDRIAGDGIAQRLRDIERAYHACLQYLMRNAANASAPICEADYRRLIAHMNDQDLGTVVPGLMYLVDTDASQSNQPALRMTNIPSNMPAYAQLMEMFMQLADRVTNIPASLHGEAVGSGAMRTFRGMSLLQGNADKAFHAAVTNISNGVFAPLGELLYNLNMLYSSDAAIKGDAQIITRGAEGLLQKEMEKQTAMELLQVMGSVGAQLGSVVNVAPVIAWSIKKLVAAMGVPDDIINSMGNPSTQAMNLPSNPDSNPNPGPMSMNNVNADVSEGVI